MSWFGNLIQRVRETLSPTELGEAATDVVYKINPFTGKMDMMRSKDYVKLYISEHNVSAEAHQDIRTELSQKESILVAGTNITITPNADGTKTVSSADIELFIVVTELPDVGIENRIYLVSNDSSGTDDVFDEWAYISGAWEKLGSIRIDLSNYYTKTETDTLLGAKANEVSNFTVASARANIATGNTVTTIFGKLAKWFTDLKKVAWTADYFDLEIRQKQFTGDLNSLFIEGLYFASDITNLPVPHGAWVIRVIPIAGTYTIQVAYPYTYDHVAVDDPIPLEDKCIWTRSRIYDGGGLFWNAWHRVCVAKGTAQQYFTGEGKLKNFPSIPVAPGTLNTTATTAQMPSDNEALSGNVVLHKVSKTGKYVDLIDAIPKNHASAETTYGIATEMLYGHARKFNSAVSSNGDGYFPANFEYHLASPNLNTYTKLGIYIGYRPTGAIVNAPADAGDTPLYVLEVLKYGYQDANTLQIFTLSTGRKWERVNMDKWIEGGRSLNNALNYIKAQTLFQCSGDATWNGTNLLWNEYFRAMNVDRSIAPSGYIDIYAPVVGTVIAGLGGTAAVTVTSAGVPIALFQALIFRHNTGENAGTFYIAQYNAAMTDIYQYNDIIVACSTGSKLKICTGQILSPMVKLIGGMYNYAT